MPINNKKLKIEKTTFFIGFNFGSDYSTTVPNSYHPESIPDGLYYLQTDLQFLQLPIDRSTFPHGYNRVSIFAVKGKLNLVVPSQSRVLLLQIKHPVHLNP